MLANKFDSAGVAGETVGEIAFRRIRTDIIHGRLKPLDRLKLDVLRESYAVSVSTLREILSRLISEEFVVAEGQRGFHVAPISQQGLHDIADLRLLLETHALARSIALGDLNWEGNVVAAHYKLSAVENQLLDGTYADVEEWVKHDWGFHHATISACNSPSLMQTHSSVFDRFLRYHMLVLDFRGPAAAAEHAQLRDLVLARKTEAAVDLLRSHVGSGVAHILGTGKIP
ncbi:FCD domain-containing protein [Puniceibacterium sp. HSS470]|jgi:DNA-binding GntR family transcriptional regulator|nr:FCD domain-containing protein [Puniceibacterium sp. HSS470]|tara:strand:- start:69594 stop:70280 length:687 start_codon:yes stop_codon:yes gene_type:complete